MSTVYRVDCFEYCTSKLLGRMIHSSDEHTVREYSIMQCTVLLHTITLVILLNGDTVPQL